MTFCVALATELQDEFRQRYEELLDQRPYDTSQPSMARRSLKNACLSFLVEAPGGAELASQQLEASDNMTDTLAALVGLVHTAAESAAAALNDFEQRFRDDSLVMDKWFSIQATKPGSETVARTVELLEHPAFSLKNPNKVRALIGSFAMSNPTGFHTRGGAGYRFLADQIIALDCLNPQVAARLATSFNNWRRYDEDRQLLMKNELQRVAAAASFERHWRDCLQSTFLKSKTIEAHFTTPLPFRGEVGVRGEVSGTGPHPGPLPEGGFETTSNKDEPAT